MLVTGNAALGKVGLEVDFVKPARRGREGGPNDRAGIIHAIVKGYQEAVLSLNHIGLVFQVSVDILLLVPGSWLTDGWWMVDGESKISRPLEAVPLGVCADRRLL